MIEPRLEIGLRDEGSRRTAHLRLTSTLAPARLLRGKTPADALRLVPLLFNLCPAAHHAAAASALGLPPRDDADLALAREILREHCLVTLRDWPRAFGIEPDSADIAGLAHLLASELGGIETRLFGMSASAFLDQAPDHLPTDAGPLPLRLLGIAARWPDTWGAMPSDGDPTFLSRCLSDPVVAAMASSRPISLHLRMFARLREAARVIEEIRAVRPLRRYGSDRPGHGWAEAARGRLIHQVKLEAGLCADYRISTPTEAMIEPGGFLETLLNSALSAPTDKRMQLFALALACASPCLDTSTMEAAA